MQLSHAGRQTPQARFLSVAAEGPQGAELPQLRGDLLEAVAVDLEHLEGRHAEHAARHRSEPVGASLLQSPVIATKRMLSVIRTYLAAEMKLQRGCISVIRTYLAAEIKLRRGCFQLFELI